MSGTKRDCQCPRVHHAHGTRSGYLLDRCRCAPCKAAHATHHRNYRLELARRHWNGGTCWTDSTGTRRRLEALAAIGWSTRELAPHFGMTMSGVQQLKKRLGPRCLIATAERVRVVYDRLWDVPPTGSAVERTRRWALRAGHAVPMAWDDIDDPYARPQGSPNGPAVVDEIAVDEAIAGRRVTLTKPERVEAVRRLTEAGWSKAAIAAHLGTYERQIERDRAEGRAA